MRTVFSSVVAVALIAVPFASHAAVERTPVTVNPSGVVVSIPARAIEVAPNVFSLGETADASSGKKVEGYMIVHKAKDRDNEARLAGGGARKSACYGFIAPGAKWKVNEPWVMNASNDDGLGASALLSRMVTSVSRWEDAADGVMGNGGMDIIGTGSLTTDPLVADNTTTDGSNEVMFGYIDEGATIGVTIVWGFFGGLVETREIVEWDQVYNTAYDWSLSGEVGKMDFQNIATHELGHTFGLADLYTTGCANETMYGYGALGETKKRTLNPGDILGISTLY